MADIDIVPKKGGISWVIWLVLALVAIAVIWMLVGRDDGASDVSSPLPHTPPAVQALPAPSLA